MIEVAQAIGTRAWQRVRPRIQQWESVTGRRISPATLRSWVEAELEADMASAQGARSLDIQEENVQGQLAIGQEQLAISQGRLDWDRERGTAQLAMDREAIAKAASTARMQGIGQLAVGGAMLAQTGIGKAAIGAVGGLLGIGGGAAAPTAYAASATGAVAGLGAGTGTLAAAPVSAGPAAAGAGTMAFLAPAAGGVAGGMAGRALEETSFGEITPWGGETISGAAGGAAAGAAIGSIVPGIGTLVGGVIGAITGGTIICTELARQGYLSADIVKADHEYRVKHISDNAYAGYLKLAKPVVRWMRDYKYVTGLIAPFGCATAHEMASRVNPDIKGSWLGKCVLAVGLPICKLVSKLKRGDN